MSNLRILVSMLVAVMALGQMAIAQVHTVTASNETVLPGDSLIAIIALTNEEGARGFSLGLAHPGTLLTLTAIDQGTATADSNGGAGPDFEFKDLTPTGGPGGTYGVILSFGAPLDEIPVGADNAIAEFSYNCSVAAEPGSTETLSFSDGLGTPVVTTVVSVVVGTTSISRIPNKVSGSVSVGTAPPSGLSASITDPCGGNGTPPHGLGTFSWVNNGTYDSLELLEDGAVVSTLAGTATSTTYSPPVAGTFNYNIRAIRNLVTSADSNGWSQSWNAVAGPNPPTGVSCSVDQATGDTTVTWTNSGSVSAVEVSIDGVLAATLGAGATSAVVSIGGPGTYNICVRGANACGAFGTEGCCSAVRDNFFIRNDMNQDGSENIADPVQGLNYLFGGGTMDCLDSADVNDDGSVNLADIVYSLNVIFGITVGGTVPTVPAPNPGCGPDPTADAVGCASFTGC